MEHAGFSNFALPLEHPHAYQASLQPGDGSCLPASISSQPRHKADQPHVQALNKAPPLTSSINIFIMKLQNNTGDIRVFDLQKIYSFMKKEMGVTMIDHYNQQPLKTMNVKRKKAEDLLAGLLVFRTDLGAEGEELIRLLLDAGIKATNTGNDCQPSIQNILH